MGNVTCENRIGKMFRYLLGSVEKYFFPCHEPGKRNERGFVDLFRVFKKVSKRVC